MVFGSRSVVADSGVACTGRGTSSHTSITMAL